MRPPSKDLRPIPESVRARHRPFRNGRSPDTSGDGGSFQVDLQPVAVQEDRHAVTGMMIPSLLFGGYEAGTRPYGGYPESFAPFVRILDALGVASMLCKPGGAIVHETAPLRDALARDLEADRIRDCMVLRAGSLGQAGEYHLQVDVEPRISNFEPVASPSVDRVHTRMASYLVKAFYAGHGRVRSDDVVVVSLHLSDEGRTLPSAEAIQCRYRLTKQQTRIALFLAERKSDKEIAEIFSISPHTVRRHVEEILDKLEIHSRRDVAGRLSDA